MDIIKPNIEWRERLIPLDLKKVDGIALHHMASKSWNFYDVHNYHKNVNGWNGIGYNFWIGYDGKIYEGRGFNVGAGVGGHNSHVLSIGFQGDYENQKEMPKEQFEAGVELIRWLRTQLPNLKIINGHKYWNKTACPGKYFPLDKMILEAKKEETKMFEDANEALNFLADKGRILDADFWRKAIVVIPNVRWLLIKWANDLIMLEK